MFNFMSFIKELFSNKPGENVHRQLSRFGIGTFENKAIIEISAISKKIKLKASSEFSNELVELLANTIKNPVYVKGIIFSTKDLREQSDIEFEDVKNVMGVKKHIINNNLTKEQILNICNLFPDSSIQLSFKTDFGELKIKDKSPRSGKPSSKSSDEAPKADFCILTTENKEILEEYAFDVKIPFKKLNIAHTYIIKDIEISEKYKNDFAMARRMGMRIGKIIRHLNIDGKPETREIIFKA